MPRIPSRRALLSLVVTAGVSFSACGDETNASECEAVTLAYLGPKTGDTATVGLNILGGVRVAVEAFNQAHPDCPVTVSEFDTQGDPDRAALLTTTILADTSILGVVGPVSSRESDATGAAFHEAGLVTISPSATHPDLTTRGWTAFHRVLGSDAAQAPAAAKYLEDTLAAKSVFIVDDASEYGKLLADGVKQDLGALVAGTDTVSQQQTDFAPTVAKVMASGADALWYGGFYAEAGLLAKQLRAGGWQGFFVAGDGANDPGFVATAGEASAADARLTCTCGPASDAFAAAYKATNAGKQPGTYSAEAYDATKILLDGIAEGKTDRASLLKYVDAYDEPGITKHLAFDGAGDVTPTIIYAYRVEGGAIVPDAEIK